MMQWDLEESAGGFSMHGLAPCVVQGSRNARGGDGAGMVESGTDRTPAVR